MSLEEIKQIITRLLEKMAISSDSIESVTLPDNSIRFNIQTKESRIFIGTRGEHIAAFNHLVKKIIHQKEPVTQGGESQKITIDVNNYLEVSNRQLKNKALLLAERARSFKSSIEMELMNPYERMMVHSFLASEPHIATASTGEGKNRRIVIKYTEETTKPDREI